MVKDGPEFFMREALREAEKAYRKDEVPIGCVIVNGGGIVARAHNLRETKSSPLAHAEILCLEKAARKISKSWRLDLCDIYVTVEPCPMCVGAILQSRIRAIYFGVAEPRTGSLVSRVDLARFYPVLKRPVIRGGILEAECKKVLQLFFRELRAKKKVALES